MSEFWNWSKCPKCGEMYKDWDYFFTPCCQVRTDRSIRQ